MICGGTTHPQILRGLDLLPRAIVDQHFLKRNRIQRLVDAVQKNRELTGYGIDEATAIVVTDDKVRVVGKSYVVRVKMSGRNIEIDVFKDGDTFPLEHSLTRR